MRGNVNGGGAAGAPSGGNRCVAVLRGVPYTTRLVLAVNLAVFVAENVYESMMYEYMISPYHVVKLHEFSRLFVPAFMHANVLHILFNMFSYFYLGPRVEAKFGSLPTLGMIVMFVLTSNVIYSFVGWYGFELTGWKALLTPAVGFSGVIFSLIAVDVMQDPMGRRSVMGFCAVPAWIYPWVLLVMFSVMMSNVSFLGHLSGLLVGWLYAKGYLDWLALPRDWIIAFEEKEWMKWMSEQDTFAKCARTPVFDRPPSPCLRACQHVGSVLRSCAPANCCASLSSLMNRVADRQRERSAQRRQQRNEYAPVVSDAIDSFDSDLEAGNQAYDDSLELQQVAQMQQQQQQQPQGSNNDVRNARQPDRDRRRAHHQSRLLDRMSRPKREQAAGFGLREPPPAPAPVTAPMSANPHFREDDGAEAVPELPVDAAPSAPPLPAAQRLPRENPAFVAAEEGGEFDAELQAALERSMQEQ